MQILSGNLNSSPLPQATCLTLGNFDGVHLGHIELLNCLKKISSSEGFSSAVLTFDPHPRQFFSPDKFFFRILSSAYQEILFSQLGVSCLVRLPFDREMASLSAENFLHQILIEKLNVRALVVGHDFCFGANRKGTIDFLREQQKHSNFKLTVLPPKIYEGAPISSSRIREALRIGKLDMVASMLGREYIFESTVITGAGRGRRIGMPTANLDVRQRALPQAGVYWGWAFRLDQPELQWPSVANLGTNPTFEATGALQKFEVHILDQSNLQLYEARLGFRFGGYLRAEKKFASSSELIEQIQTDIAQARNFFSKAGGQRDSMG